MAILIFQVFLCTFPFLQKDNSGYFMQGARELASKATSKIILIDGIVFAMYMIEFNVGVSTRKTYEVKRIDTDYFEE